MSVDHTEYWEEVTRERFQAKFDDRFVRAKRTLPPVLFVEDKVIRIQKDGEVYEDFKIDFSGDTPRFYLHNYGFWV
jgi:hypothetical protein